MSEPHIRDLFDLSGQVALITGGSKGLGRSIGLGFAQAGATVVLASRDEAACAAAAGVIATETGSRAAGLAVDVTNEASVAAMVSRVVDEHGAVDILVNSAGVNIRHPIEAFPLADFRTVMDVNLTGSWLCCRAVSEHMQARGGGSVINLSSALGGIGLAERTAYCSSKHGVIGLTRTLALEWAPYAVRCNALCPGPFLTEMNRPLLDQPERARAIVGATAFGRWAELHEIRGAALFLAAPASTYVTGTTLFVDGGWTAG